MKYFQKIPKDWKEQGAAPTCERCGQPISESNDHFTVHAHWKIKDDPDEYRFCSLNCMQEWASEDSLEKA